MIEMPIEDKGIKLSKTSNNFRFSAAVAGFGMLLRESEYKGDLNYEKVTKMAKGALGEDTEGYRHEFLKLVEKSELLK